RDHEQLRLRPLEQLLEALEGRKAGLALPRCALLGRRVEAADRLRGGDLTRGGDMEAARRPPEPCVADPHTASFAAPRAKMSSSPPGSGKAGGSSAIA